MRRWPLLLCFFAPVSAFSGATYHPVELRMYTFNDSANEAVMEGDFDAAELALKQMILMRRSCHEDVSEHVPGGSNSFLFTLAYMRMYYIDLVRGSSSAGYKHLDAAISIEFEAGRIQTPGLSNSDIAIIVLERWLSRDPYIRRHVDLQLIASSVKRKKK